MSDTCAVKGCQHPATEEYQWHTPEGDKRKWYCDRHVEFVRRSRNSKRVTP